MSNLSRLGAALAFVPLLLFLVAATVADLGDGCGFVVVVITFPLGVSLWLVGLLVAPAGEAQKDRER